MNDADVPICAEMLDQMIVAAETIDNLERSAMASRYASKNAVSTEICGS